MPGTANMLTHAPVLGSLAKAAAGIAPQRQIPAFAPQTFKEWFGRRGARNEGQPQVILWPDTFTNHFHPATAQVAVEVLIPMVSLEPSCTDPNGAARGRILPRIT
jgi:hypothetical protein